MIFFLILYFYCIWLRATNTPNDLDRIFGVTKRCDDGTSPVGFCKCPDEWWAGFDSHIVALASVVYGMMFA
jgi:hypothetical protein